jgi:dihydroorotate dehydrogenase (NAD+) catalytic subunit
MNVSCPNIKKGGVEFGTDPVVLRDLVRACRPAIKKPLLVKLTPNCTDVVALARAAMEGGADGLAVINTLSAMAIDARRRRPRIATVFGGLSGPAIKPIALRMVHQVHRALPDAPISGIGGVTSGEDVVEFLLAGATTVQVGTQSFAEPGAAARVVDELERFLVEEKVADVRELIGALRVG